MTGEFLLSKFVSTCQMLSGSITAYLNTTTGKIIIVTEDATFIENPDEEERYTEPELNEEEMINSKDYIEIPNQYFFHESRMMKPFSLNYPNEEISDDLLQQIQGRGAFRRFKNSVHFHGIENKWYKFRDKEYKRIAKDWLKDHELQFNDDIE